MVGRKPRPRGRGSRGGDADGPLPREPRRGGPAALRPDGARVQEGGGPAPAGGQGPEVVARPPAREDGLSPRARQALEGRAARAGARAARRPRRARREEPGREGQPARHASPSASRTASGTRSESSDETLN